MKGFAFDAVNSRIRKDLTVGKKLKASDCPSQAPEPKNQESYEYSNSASPTGRLGNLLGIEETVYFPGGSGRTSNTFVTFDLTTGKLFSLDKCLKSDGLEKLKAAYCGAVKMWSKTDEGKAGFSKDEIEPAIEAECKMPNFQLVVQNDGINAATWVGKSRGLVLEKAFIKGADLTTYFKTSCLR